MLPDIPEGIYETFVAPLNTEENTVFDSQPEGRWYFHFGGYSVKEFNQLNWSKIDFTVDVSSLHPDSVLDIQTLVENVLLDRKASPIWDPENSNRRIGWHKAYVLETGRLCAPILGVNTVGGIRILDGSHRIASLILLKKPLDLEMWYGK